MPVQFLPLPLARFNKLVNLAIFRELRTLDVNATREQEYILRALVKRDGINQVELAIRVSQDRNNLSRTLSLLEKRGLIRRSRDDSDKRNSVVHITPAGRKFHKAAFKAIEAYWKVMYKDLTQEEIDTFAATLDRMTENLEAYMEDEQPRK